MEVTRLIYWMNDLVAPIVEIDGLLFIDRHNVGDEAIRKQILEYASPDEAQNWINVILIEGFIDELGIEVDNFLDPKISALLDLYIKAWRFHIAALHPEAIFSIEKLSDNNSNDLGLRLMQ